MSGYLRIVEWLREPGDPIGPVHAYNALGPTSFHGICGTGQWTVRLASAETGPLCPICREVVASAAFGTLEAIRAIEETRSAPDALLDAELEDRLAAVGEAGE